MKRLEKDLMALAEIAHPVMKIHLVRVPFSA